MGKSLKFKIWGLLALAVVGIILASPAATHSKPTRAERSATFSTINSDGTSVVHNQVVAEDDTNATKAEQTDLVGRCKDALTGIAKAATRFPGLGDFLDKMIEGMQPRDIWMVGLGLFLAAGLLIRRLLK